MVPRALAVTQESFQSLPLVLLWCIHESCQAVCRESYVRSGAVGYILDIAKYLTVFVGFSWIKGLCSELLV